MTTGTGSVGTQHIVLLFVDVVSSTELAMAHSAAEADEIRRRYFSLLRQAVADTGGDEVKGLGDGIMVAFPTASTAIACAVAMQQAMELDGRDRDHPVRIRVGLSGGEATYEDGDWYGDPAVEAARLCAACEPDQILAADVVRLMAGRRTCHPSRPVGALDLKGLTHTVDAVEIGWEPIGPATEQEGTFPLPSRLAIRPDVGVVGRVSQLDLLGDAAKRVTTDPLREVVILSGEAGVGKTTIVAEMARRMHDGGACVLFGHCEEDLATPYQLFAEALHHFVAHAPEPVLRAHVERHGPELVRLVPQLAERLPDLPPSRTTDADSERYQVFAAVVAVLSDASAHRPIVLVLDDLQWADRTSLLLLRHLVAVDAPGHLLVLGTFRDDELTPTHPLLETLASFHRHQRVTRVDLGGLTGSEVAAFLEAASGESLDAEGATLADAVLRETDGNPFFVSEVLRNLAESGAIARDPDGRWHATRPIEQVLLPDSLREVIVARVGRLDDASRRVLSMAAVIGRDFDIDLLARAVERSDDDVVDLLAPALAAALVREHADAPGYLSFSHALIQHAVYEDVGGARRTIMHRVLAEALERLCGDRSDGRIGELARHWCSTGRTGDAPKAVHFARRAADVALAALAPSDALQWYRQALRVARDGGICDGVTEIDLLTGIGTAQRQAGDPGFRETLLDASRRADLAGDTDRLVVAVVANDRGWSSANGSVDAEKVALLERAAEQLPPDHPDRALVLATLCAEFAFAGTLDRRSNLVDEALAIATARGDDAAIVRVLNHAALPLLVCPHMEESLAWSIDALDRARRIDDPVLVYFAAIARDSVATRAGDAEGAAQALAIAEPLVRQLEQPPMVWEYEFHHARHQLMLGNVDRAEAEATQALQVGLESGQPDAETYFGVQLAAVSWMRGTMGDLAPLLEQMVADTPELPTIRAALAMSYAAGDQVAEAERVLAEFAGTGFELPQDSAWLAGMNEYALAAITLGDPVFAGPILEQLAPYPEQFASAGGLTAEGPVASVLGGLAAVLGRARDADDYFSCADEWCEGAGAVFFHALNDVLWSGLLLSRDGPGDAEQARLLATRAVEVATARGYGGVLGRATVLLA